MTGLGVQKAQFYLMDMKIPEYIKNIMPAIKGFCTLRGSVEYYDSHSIIINSE